jgi:acetyltransferase-like isoleucine patch superfamily enzyme
VAAALMLQPSDYAPGLLLGVNAVVYPGTEIGADCEIDHGAVVGKPPRLGRYSAAPRQVPAPAVLGDGAAVGCAAVVCAGARIGAGAVVGDHALVREQAVLGAESVIGHASSLGVGAIVGDRVRIMSKCGLAPGTRVEDDVFIASFVVTVDDATAGRRTTEPTEVVLRRGCRIGAGAVILPGVEIGEGALVGAGAVVARSVPAGMLVRGEPARLVGEAQTLN